MQQQAVFNIYVDICPECHGIWFDGGELGRVADGFELGRWPAIFERWKQRSTKVPSFLHQPNKEPREMSCPRHHGALQSHFYAGDSGIEVDFCEQCEGFWIDGGEVTKIWEYNKPDPTRDAIAAGLFKEMTWSERLRERVATQTAYVTSLFIAPANLGLFALAFLVRFILDDLIAYEAHIGSFSKDG